MGISGTRILGVDPGSHHLGLGYVLKQGNKLTHLRTEVLSPPTKASFYDRLTWIGERLETILNEIRPDEVAIEDLFHAKNARSAFHLGMARGVAIAHCCRFKLPIYEYAPTHVKMVVTGYGRADKEQVKKMVELTLGEKIDGRWDATDALAVAICHSFSNRLEAAMKGSKDATL